MIGRWPGMPTVEGPPPVNGLYAAEVYFGWKLLEWFNGEWWHMNRVGRWTANIPAQWVGPLPDCLGGVDRTPHPPKQEFDL